MIKLEKYAADDRQLRQFAVILAVAFAGIAGWQYWRNDTLPLWILVLSGILLIVGTAIPRCLAFFYSLWMNLGHGLGWINTRLILGLMFYVILTPVGLFLRILGKCGLQLKTLPEAKTYALRSESRPSNHFDRMF